MKRIIIWYNPNKGVYYHRYVNDFSNYCQYSIGYKNQYEHEIVYMIQPNYDYYNPILKEPLKRKCVNKLISFLKKYS